MRKLTAVVAALACAAPAWAVMLGPARLSPHYGLETRYEDNIYRVPRDQNGHAVAGGGVRGSWIVSNNAGLSVSVPAGQHGLSLGYDVTAENYKTQPKANDAINQKAKAGWTYEGSKVDAKVWDEYVNTQDPAFNPNGAVIGGDLVARERRWQNTLGASAEYALGEKFFFGVEGETAVHKYLNRAGGTASLAHLLNRSEQAGGFKTGYRIAPKTRVYVSGRRRVVHYTEGTRRDNHRDWLGAAGVEGNLTAKLTGRVETGGAYLEYDRDSSNPSRGRLGREWRVNTELEFKARENCSWTLRAVRSTNESSSTQARYFTSSGALLRMTHQLGAKLTASLGGGVQYDRYEQDFTFGSERKPRRDDNYQAGAAADYKFKEWLSGGVSYAHTSRFSTFSRQFNYKDNVTGSSVRLTF